MTPLVSAICLTRSPQRAEMLAEALRSFALQTHTSKELVVVNDGAPLAPAAAGVTVVNLPSRMTIGAKRNAGTLAAHGALIAPWDDDDFSMPERMEIQVAQLAQSRAPAVRSSLMWLATSDLRVHGLLPSMSYPTVMIRREVLERLGHYPDLDYLEDHEVYLRMRMRGLRDFSAPGDFYVHRRHSANVSAPFEKEAKFFNLMLPSPDVDRINERLATLRALDPGILVKPLHGSVPAVPERVSAATAPAGWAGR